MSMTESAETLTLYQMSIMTLCTAGLLTLGFRAPHWGDALMVALAGVGNGIAQFWWTRSLSLAPPSAVVPFNYPGLPEDALDHADGDPIDLGDLGDGQPVLHPGSDAGVVRPRDLAGGPGGGVDWWCNFLVADRRRRQDRQHARFPRGLLGRWRGVRD
jgi:hypothetical protein